MKTACMAVVFVVLAAAGCAFDVDVDVYPSAGSTGGEDSTGLGGSGVVQGSTGIADDSTSEGSSSGGESSEGSSSGGESSTGEPPAFVCLAPPAVIDDQCSCEVLPGVRLPLDPALCGCAVLGSGECACPTELHPAHTCGWTCELGGPTGCLCGDSPAPAGFCAECRFDGMECSCAGGCECVTPPLSNGAHCLCLGASGGWIDLPPGEC